MFTSFWNILNVLMFLGVFAIINIVLYTLVVILPLKSRSKFFRINLWLLTFFMMKSLTSVEGFYILGWHHYVFHPVLFVILNFVLVLLVPYFVSILFLPFLIGLAFKFYPRLENENRKAFIKRRLFVALKVFAICILGLYFYVFLWNDWFYPTSFAAIASVILLVIMRGKIFAGAKNPFVIPEGDIENKPPKKLFNILWIGLNSAMMALLLFMIIYVRFL